MSVEHYILEAGKSSELAAALRLLAEAGEGGEPRFPPDACRAVAKAIVCRTYAPALLELCHLTRAVSAFRGGYVDFFWGPGPVRPSRFRGQFCSTPLSGAGFFKIAANGIDLIYRDKPFSIAFGRMPFLAALAEFLVTSIGFAGLDDALAPLSRPALTAADVSAQANALSRALYDWLKDHLPPVQAQRKLTLLVEFLKPRNGGDFKVESIDDQAILDFWRASAASPGFEDFRTFRSAFMAFARLRQVIGGAEALRAIDHAGPIGSAREHGEIDPDEIESAVEAITEEGNPLDELAEPPASRIKFFNAKERELCRFLFECGRLADPLPLSFMRCEVFGAAQARISQGIRERVQGPRLAALIEESCCLTDYGGHQEALSDLVAHGRTVLLASTHLITAAGLIVLPRKGNIVPFRTKSVSDPSIACAGVESLLDEARRAAKGISRQGFRSADLADPEVCEGYLTGVPLVAEVADRIAAFLETLSRLALPSGGWDAQFGEDKPVFIACFKAIYGGPT